MYKRNLKYETVPISEFKSKALRYLAVTEKNGKEYCISKRGVPIAYIVPAKNNNYPHKGSLKGLLKIKGDILKFNISSDWEVLKK